MKRNPIGTAVLLAGLALGGAACDDGNAFPDEPVGPGGSTDTGSIFGQVRAGTGVGGAQVTIIDGDSATTNASGEYRFERIRSGDYTLSLGVPTGFALAPADSARKGVTVTPGRTSTVNWTLTPTGGGL